MEAKFSPRVKDVIAFSREEALRLGHDYIGTEHLLLGLIREGDGMAIKILKTLGVDTARVRHSVEEAVKGTSTTSLNLGNIPLTKQAEKVLKITYLEAKIFKSEIIGTEHLLLSILRDEEELYCLGDIVHNNKEVDRLNALGLKIIDTNDLKNLKDCKVLIRAHGEPPSTYELALKNNIQLLDASCPVVLKLQLVELEYHFFT